MSATPPIPPTPLPAQALPEALPQALHAEGLELKRQGRLDEALDRIGRAVDLAPEDAHLRNSFGLVLALLGATAAAATAFRTALALAPAVAVIWSNLGNAAERAEARALAIAPGNARARGNLAIRLRLAGDAAAAERLLRQALALAPAFAEAWSNLGAWRQDEADLAFSGRAYDRALASDPGLAEARFNRACNRMLQGDYRNAWADYEARWHKPGAVRPPTALPSWQGEDIAGKRLLLWAEQGQGDVIQFLRFVPAVAARGARVVLLVSRQLLPVARSLAGVSELAAIGAAPPAADVAAPLLSLPLLLGLGDAAAQTMPPYLRAPVATSPPTRLSAGDERPRIGLVWSGNPANEVNPVRALALVRLMPALALPGLRWISLQVGSPSAEIAAAGLSDRIEDMSEHLIDFGVTADIIAGLDLLVTTDTSVPHLAGAMGKETWLMLAHVPDWRWGMSGETTSWYPSMRLFRQQRRGDWEGVVDRLAAALVQRFGLHPGCR
jgi:Flp pilus assembly protein TadD